MKQAEMRKILLQVFTERELSVLQIKMYNVVCCQPNNYYTENNIILEKLGGAPIEAEVAHDE